MTEFRKLWDAIYGGHPNPVKPLTYQQAVKSARRHDFIATARRHGYLSDGVWLYKLPADEAAKIKGEESDESPVLDIPAFLRTLKDNAPIGKPEEERVIEGMVQWKFTTGFRVAAVAWLTVCKRWPDAEVNLSGNVAVWRQGGEIVGAVQGLSRKD